MKKFFIAAIAYLAPLAAKAQDLGGTLLDNTAVKSGGYKNTPIEQLVGNTIKIALDMIGVVFLVLIVYGGYLWMIARGDEGKVEKAKETLINSSIGLIITIAAYGITFFIVNQITASALK